MRAGRHASHLEALDPRVVGIYSLPSSCPHINSIFSLPHHSHISHIALIRVAHSISQSATALASCSFAPCSSFISVEAAFNIFNILVNDHSNGKMHTRRTAHLSSLVLPHPPLPARPPPMSSRSSSSSASNPSPCTPRSSAGQLSPVLFKLDAGGPRRSTDSWGSSIQDGGDDDMDWEWTNEQMKLLNKVCYWHAHTSCDHAHEPS